MDSRVLVGWKEIAAYLGSSVATAMRRVQVGLPVFRSGGQVMAFPADIDRWLKKQRAEALKMTTKPEEIEKVEEAEDISSLLTTLQRSDTKEKYVIVRLGKDVADFERVEVQLKSAEERYHALIDEIPEWVWEMNADGEFIHSSRRVADILGYDPEDILGLKMDEEFLHEDDVKKYRKAFARLVKDKKLMRDFQCRLIHQEGSIRYVETSASPLFDEGGKLVGVKGISHDITERKRLEEVLQESEERFRSMMETATDAIISVDGSGRIVSWNRSAEGMFGYSADEAVGKPLTLMMPKRFHKSFRDGMKRLAETGESGVIGRVNKLVGRKKDGSEFSVEVTHATWKTKGKNFFTAIVRDITERKREAEEKGE